jgi:Fe-S-cluster containining protein
MMTIFGCTQCGECCRGFGGTHVSDADIDAIARFLGTTPEVVADRYCQRSGSRRVVAQRRPGGYCVFWQEGLCGIHPVKPRMCRDWPYIESVLVDVINWHSMASTCPGMRTDVSDAEIRREVSRHLAQRQR